jgi:hypothetical protein
MFGLYGARMFGVSYSLIHPCRHMVDAEAAAPQRPATNSRRRQFMPPQQLLAGAAPQAPGSPPRANFAAGAICRQVMVQTLKLGMHLISLEHALVIALPQIEEISQNEHQMTALLACTICRACRTPLWLSSAQGATGRRAGVPAAGAGANRSCS